METPWTRPSGSRRSVANDGSTKSRPCPRGKLSRQPRRMVRSDTSGLTAFFVRRKSGDMLEPYPNFHTAPGTAVDEVRAVSILRRCRLKAGQPIVGCPSEIPRESRVVALRMASGRTWRYDSTRLS